MKSLVLLISIGVCFGQPAKTLTSDLSTYGDMKIQGKGTGADINAGSSMQRRVVAINDSWCPLQIKGPQLIPKWDGSSYVYTISGNVQASKQATVLSFELDYRIYDPLGNKIRDLYWEFVTDLKPGASVPLNQTFEFPTSWMGEAKVAYATVFWIGRVRLLEGGKETVWTPGNVEDEIAIDHATLFPVSSHHPVQ